MKNIRELTDDDAKQILEFVYPNDGYLFTGISFDIVVCSDGKVEMTFGFRPAIGINFHNGQDACILYFDSTKVVLWLYKNGFDIGEFLEANKYLSNIERDFENFAFGVSQLSRGEQGFAETHKQNWSLEYVKRRCTELLNTYFYKDYK